MMSANLRAFLFLIRWAEGTSGPDGYRTMVGGSLIDDLSDHPRKVLSGTFSNGVKWSSSAAGAYQFLSSTWDRCRAALDLADFSPESQDRAAIWLIEQRKALPAVERGDLLAALDLCSWEWASLPPSRYGQPIKSYDACATIFERAGGTISQAAGATQPAPPPPAVSPEPVSAPPAPVTTESAMPLPVAAAVSLATELWRIIRPTDKVAQASAAIEKATPVLLEAAKQAVPSAVNEQQAVEQIKANPGLQAQFRQTAMLRWDDLAPILEFEAKERREAREFTERMTGDGPFWRQIGYGILIAGLSITIIGGIGYIFHQVLFGPADAFSQSTRDGIIQVLINVGVLVVGFYFGSSASNRQKDTTIADQAKR